MVSMLLIGPFGHLSLVLSKHLGLPGSPPLFIFHLPSLKILGMMHLLTYWKRGLNRKPISLKKEISVWSLPKLYCLVLVWCSMMHSSLQSTMMRNVLVHRVRPIYLESLLIHTEHCRQQDNPIYTLPLWYSEFVRSEGELYEGLFNVLYWFSRKCDKHISYRPEVCLNTKGVW